ARAEVLCGTDEAPIAHFYTGMTSSTSSEERKLLLSQGYGLGILFHDFQGMLEQSDEIEANLPTYLKKGGLDFLEYEINRDACLRLVEYKTEYEERGYGAHYGLPNRPRYGEGAGCTAYAVSFLELAGLETPEMRASWSRTIEV